MLVHLILDLFVNPKYLFDGIKIHKIPLVDTRNEKALFESLFGNIKKEVISLSNKKKKKQQLIFIGIKIHEKELLNYLMIILHLRLKRDTDQ